MFAGSSGRSYGAFHYTMLILVVAALVTAATAIGFGAASRLRGDPNVHSIYRVTDGSSVAGASSMLTRTDSALQYRFTTKGLPAGHIVMLRAEIFNNPQNCTHGAQGHLCGAADLAVPAVHGSVVYLWSTTLHQVTSVKIAGTLTKHTTSGVFAGAGLTSPRGADIDLILLDKGPPASGLYGAQLSTWGGGCKDVGARGGPPGPNACADIQVSTYDHG